MVVYGLSWEQKQNYSGETERLLREVLVDIWNV